MPRRTLIEGLIGGNFAENRGNAVLALSYDKRDELLAGAREFSNVSLGPNLLPAGSPTTPDGSVAWGANGPTQAALDTVFGRYGVAANTVRPGQTLGFNQDHSLFSFGSATLAGVDVANYKGDTIGPGLQPEDLLLQLRTDQQSAAAARAATGRSVRSLRHGAGCRRVLRRGVLAHHVHDVSLGPAAGLDAGDVLGHGARLQHPDDQFDDPGGSA